jgi:RNA polymerase sigma-70 factor (ECF subfamily)
MPTGDDEFRSFYERMHDRAVRTARRLAGDPVLAEDLAAEALARAYARWRTVRSHPNPDAWLLRVLGNLAIDHLRRRGRSGPGTADGTAGDRTDVEAVLRVDLARAMGSLSGRQREVVVMRYLADLSEEEVAATLGMSSGSVKTHLSRATHRLRTELGDAAEPDGVRP